MTTTRAAWLALGLAFLLLEGWTLVDGVPGNTLSGEVQALARTHPWAYGALAAGLGWLAYHWIVDRRQRR